MFRTHSTGTSYLIYITCKILNKLDWTSYIKILKPAHSSLSSDPDELISVSLELLDAAPWRRLLEEGSDSLSIALNKFFLVVRHYLTIRSETSTSSSVPIHVTMRVSTSWRGTMLCALIGTLVLSANAWATNCRSPSHARAISLSICCLCSE